MNRFRLHTPRPIFAALAFLALAMCVAGAPTPLVVTDFAPRPAVQSSPLFSVVSSAESGIVTENRYDDPRIWAERYQEFPVGAIGTGVAVADYDGDGRPDLFVVSKTESCRLFRNLGDWKFEDVTAKAGVGDLGADARVWKQGAAFADVNNDGWLDLYVCRFDAPNRLYINQRDGTFKEEAALRGLAVSDASGMAAFCDYDRDGWLDVYIVTNMRDAARLPGGQADYLFRNNRDGTFADVTSRAGIHGVAQGHSATWWDYNGDSWPDLYVANDFSAPDRLYRNLRDGTFGDVTDEVLPVMPHHSMGADIGDFDGDGLIDFYVADMARTSHVREQETIADTRARVRVAPRIPGGPCQVMRSALYLATKAGPCREAAWMAGMAATDWAWAVRAEDFDLDGRLDLFVTNGMVRDYDNVDLRDRVMATESSGARVQIMRTSSAAADHNLVFRNLGELQFEESGAAWGLDHRTVSFGAATGDLDGDGDMDLVYANYQAGVTVCRNDGQVGRRAVIALRGVRSNRFGVGAVVRLETERGSQVRQLALARGYQSTSEPIVHFGLGEAERIVSLTVEWPSGAVQRFADLPVDRKFTISEPEESDPAPRAASPSSDFARFCDVTAGFAFRISGRERADFELPAGPGRLAFARMGPSLALGDLDGDGRDELAIGATTLEPALVLRMEANAVSAFSSLPITPDEQLGDGPIVIFDADGDGVNDLLVTKTGGAKLAGLPDYQPRLLVGDGRGGWRLDDYTLPPLLFPVGAAVTADFDRDGRMDLFVGGRSVPGRYPQIPPSVLLLNRPGRFVDATPELAPGLRQVGLVTSAVACDVDRDGWPDLVVATEWGAVRYWRNREGTAFEAESVSAGFSSAGTGWWSSLGVADFNGDGRPDFAAGNVGLNTRYRATAHHPAVLFFGRFLPGAEWAVIEAHWDDDRLVPWAPRRVLARSLPQLRTKFRRNADYARATLEELVGADLLAAAQRHEATELRGGVFFSQPDGAYAFQPFPRVAQISPVTAIAVADFDGDGHADIFLTQNRTHGPDEHEPATGGLGQLLLGDGHGRFEAVPPDESGLIVRGDARAVVATDLDGDCTLDLLIARNDAGARIFLQCRASAPDARTPDGPAQDHN